MHGASADSNEVGFQLYLLFFLTLLLMTSWKAFRILSQFVVKFGIIMLASDLLPSFGPFFTLMEVVT
jgi:hypothetical protein